MDKKKKLWTIERKILMPYIGFMIILPLVIIIVFNIAMRFYFEKNAKDEIRNTLEATNMLIKQQLIKRPVDLSDEIDRRRFNEQIFFVSEIFKVSKMANNTDIFVFSRNGETIFPFRSNENESIIATLKEMFPIQEIDGIQRIRVDQKSYLVAGAVIEAEPSDSENSTERLPGVKLNSRTFHAVYVSSLDYGDIWLRKLNITLLSIIGVTLLISSFFFKKIAESISKPIIEAALYADAISSGHYDKLPVHQNTAEIYRLTNSLNQMSSKLEVQDQTQRNFLQNVSHELRTPLMSIQGYAEGLVRGIFRETTHPAQIIADESIRLKGLVDELITLSRLESTSVSIQRSNVDLKLFFVEAVERAAGMALKENKHINLMCDESVSLFLDESLLEKTVSNLLSNAIRHATSQIEIRVESTLKFVKIIISDDGKGFKKNEIEFLFDRFFKGSEGNHGLGLAIVKSAVLLNGGEIKAYNGEMGAVFEIEFKL